MPISPMDDYLAHQTTDTFDHVFTSDRNFFDRYYFNLHASSDELFMVFGLGQYPNLGVTDAFASISHGDTQYTVRASRELGSDRMDTSCGPFKFEVLEGLKKLRIQCDDNEWGLAFDVTWDGSQHPLEEPKSVKKSFNRTVMDNARFAQTGCYTGSLEIDGQSYTVEPTKWKGARDRSWGVRGVGEPEPPGIRVTEERAHGFFHNWMPMQFEDYMIKTFIEEGPDGERQMEEGIKVWNYGIDKPNEILGSPNHKMRYHSGTREVAGATIGYANSDLTVENIPLRTVNLGMGSGYINTDGWGHGVYQGKEKVEGVKYDVSTPAKRAEVFGLNETLCRFEASNGDVGYGMHENFIVGIYRPYGFDEPGTMAP
ncbi:MAG: hypothetical protein CL931_04105 [Deltaproteobacteria bacterium]|nr:hypothetical protein [Deltaproteobacteria bacterium]